MADRTSTVRVNVITDASSAGASIGRFGKLAGAAALGVGALAVGTAVGVSKLYDYADAADDANAKIQNTVKQMGLFGAQTDAVTKRIEDMAKTTSLNTAVDINSIKATQAKLLTFKELGKSADTAGGNFDRATKAAIDMAALGFGTAETNAVQLGKALNDPVKGITALTRSGITFTEGEKARIAAMVEANHVGEAQAFILKAIETQVGGTAEATAGGFELMKNRVSIFAQELATKALPYLDRFGTFMIETGGPAIARFASAVGEKVLPVLRQLGGFIGERVLPVLQALGGFILNHLVPAYQTVLAGALKGARGLFNNVAKSVGDNGPALREMGDKLKRVGTFLVDNVIPVMGKFYEKVLPAIGTAIGVAITVIATLYKAFSDIYDIVVKVVGKIGDLIDKIQSIPHPDLGFLPGVGRTAASGAAGLAGLTSAELHSGGTTINIGTLVSGSDEETARKLQSILDRHHRRLSGVPA